MFFKAFIVKRKKNAPASCYKKLQYNQNTPPCGLVDGEFLGLSWTRAPPAFAGTGLAEVTNRLEILNQIDRN